MFLRTLTLVVPMVIAGCGRTSPMPPRKSPDGTLSLSTSVNRSKAVPSRYLCVVVDITDSKGRPLHHEVTPASDTQRWSIQWVSNNEVLLKSSDVGNYRIRRQTDGTWKGELGAT